MTNIGPRLLSAVSSWLRELPSRYGPLALALCILGLGVFVVLLVQPSPLTFTEGWSAPQGIDEVKLGYSHRAIVDRQDHIHLAWQKQVGRKLVAFYGRLDRHGRLANDPIRLSDPNVNAENVAVVLTSDDDPLCFWIEKGHEDKTQRLMMARPEAGEPSQIVSTSSKIMRDLAVTSNEEGRIFLAWSDNRQGLYDIYMTALDAEGNLSFSERRVTDTEKAFIFQPALAAGGGIVHLIYFSDEVIHQDLVHRTYNVAGEPLTEPQVWERVSQMGDSTQQGYPLLAVAEADGQLRLYESLGSMVRQRKIGKDGAVVLPAEPLLRGSQYYSEVSFARRGEQQWLIWADLRWGSQDRFQVYTAPLDEAGRVEEETRLTFATTSALWPVMLLDSKGGQHVIWQQSIGPYAYQLMYINNLDPGRISVWQRLGFSGVAGGWSLLLALAQSAILAVITAFINIWRPAIAWAVTALVFLIIRRVERVKPYINVVAWVVLLTVLFVTVRPQTKTLGQAPIDIAGAARWVMGAAASVMVLYLGRVWRHAFRGILIWAGMAALWLWVYYFLNLTLILREGFAI
ncbi:MAG: hypothetical protein WBW48_17090 [Anaerolineae bacterium]